MPFVTKLYQKKTEEIAKLNEEILELFKKKSELSSKIEQLKQELKNLESNKKDINELISLDDAIIYKRKILDSITSDIEDETNSFITELLKKYPNIKPKRFCLLSKVNKTEKNRIKFTDILLTIDSSLITFAIEHNIDPNLYKKIMYSYNSSWFDRYNELKSQFKTLSPSDTENTSLFNEFIILVDDSK